VPQQPPPERPAPVRPAAVVEDQAPEEEPEHVPAAGDNNPIRREIERRKREAAAQGAPRPVQAIKSIQRSSPAGTILLIAGIALVVAAAALATLQFTGLFKLIK
jgi:hypothetical protein